jgi:hypothetical protein
MNHPPTVSSATQAGFDGTILLQIGKTTPLHLMRGDSLESVINDKRLWPNSLFRTTEDNRLFYYNREGKLYELTFTEV